MVRFGTVEMLAELILGTEHIAQLHPLVALQLSHWSLSYFFVGYGVHGYKALKINLDRWCKVIYLVYRSLSSRSNHLSCADNFVHFLPWHTQSVSDVYRKSVQILINPGKVGQNIWAVSPNFMMHSLHIAERTAWSWRLVYQKFTYSCNCLRLSQVLGSCSFGNLFLGSRILLLVFASALAVFIIFLVLI